MKLLIENLNGINQLSFSAVKWLHGTQIHFATFYFVKNHKIAYTTKAKEKNRCTFGIPRFLKNMWALRNLETIKFYLIK